MEYLSHFIELLWGHDCFKSIKNSKNEAVLPNPQSYKIQFVSSHAFERLWRLSLLSVRLILGTPDLFPSLTTESRMLGKPHIGAPILERFIFQKSERRARFLLTKYPLLLLGSFQLRTVHWRSETRHRNQTSLKVRCRLCHVAALNAWGLFTKVERQIKTHSDCFLNGLK